MEQTQSSSSASHKQLIGIDPDDTDVVEISGAKFTIGVLDSGIWERLTVTLQLLLVEAKRQAIARLVAQGRDPGEIVYTKKGPDDIDLTLADLETQNDGTYRAASLEAHAEIAKYGVRSHDGFFNRHGAAFPFITAEETIDGHKYQVLAPETLRVYRRNPVLLRALYLRIRKLNDFGAFEKKS